MCTNAALVVLSQIAGGSFGAAEHSNGRGDAEIVAFEPVAWSLRPCSKLC